jgi:hypothetical protein
MYESSMESQEGREADQDRELAYNNGTDKRSMAE